MNELLSDYELRLDYTAWEKFWYAVAVILSPPVAIPIIIYMSLHRTDDD